MSHAPAAMARHATTVMNAEFDVLVEGTTELSGFDPYDAAGGRNTAVSRTLASVTPSGGTITVVTQ